ncbi:MAG: hypothetical protein L0Z73_07485 [Gammaproteobacteria bacterium]|nr:hypothetical protein [Gammaproteobacteria bacterium]
MLFVTYFQLLRHAAMGFTAVLFCIFPGNEIQAAVLEDINYGFATYLGSGVYTAADQDVQVYQIPVSYQIHTTEEKKWGLKLTLPLTVGFYDFELKDIVDNGFPDDVSTFSFVPGMQFQYPVTLHWELLPFIDVGIAQNLTNGDSSNIYSYGMRSYYEYPLDNLTFILGNRLLFARQKRSDNSSRSDFGAFETSLDFRFPQFPVFKQLLADYSVYYANFQYFDSLEFLFPGDRVVNVVKQNEVGITFGVQIKKKTKYIDIPRIGLAVRRGDGLDIYRLVFGLPF